MLNNIGLPGLLLIAVVVLVLFGRGKISSLMGEVGKGITAFKRGVDDSKREIEDASDQVSNVTPPEHGDVTLRAIRTASRKTPRWMPRRSSRKAAAKGEGRPSCWTSAGPNCC